MGGHYKGFGVYNNGLVESIRPTMTGRCGVEFIGGYPKKIPGDPPMRASLQPNRNLQNPREASMVTVEFKEQVYLYPIEHYTYYIFTNW